MEPIVTRCVLLGIFLLGLVAQIFKPVGDALQGSTFAAGALLSLVAYVLYDAIKDLADGPRGGQSPSRFANPTSRAVLIKEAEAGRIVDVRFIGYTGESMFDHLRGTLMRLHESPGRVHSVTFRVLTPDMSGPMHIPSKLNSDGTCSDDPEFRRYAAGRTEDYANHLLFFARRLRDHTQIQVSIKFRTYPGIPAFQACLIGDNTAFLAFYDIAREAEFPYGQPDRILLDPVISQAGRTGWDARDGTPQSEHMVRACSDFFESMWKISTDAPWGENTLTG
ncbi:hypothetical protein [Streptomyces djakartensis]|uniref:ATP/GTP-binding protein n=1 Tax=Streptomyces djakartensis TaxID=68193 RepID=A0ABQ2ZZ59_9ACTN|nr:hypothetical protein [Streptomyces djakartensis]GGY29930.1 ATP/GTP-binding protein [Streptomyces djakartensis]